MGIGTVHTPYVGRTPVPYEDCPYMCRWVCGLVSEFFDEKNGRFWHDGVN